MMENFNKNAPPHTPETRGGFATRDPHTLYNKNPQNDYLCDIGLDLQLPKRIAWTEYAEEATIWHYTTEDEFNKCANLKNLGISMVR